MADNRALVSVSVVGDIKLYVENNNFLFLNNVYFFFQGLLETSFLFLDYMNSFIQFLLIINQLLFLKKVWIFVLDLSKIGFI